MNYKKEAGRRLRGARTSKGWSLKELSGKVQNILSESRLSNYEQGTRMMGTEEALALHRVLDVQPSYLLCVDVEEGEMTQQETELLQNFRTLPANERQAYARRIAVLALAYREPVPDERLSPEVRKGPARKRTPQK